MFFILIMLNQKLIPKTSKEYFYEMWKYRFMQQIEKEQDQIRDTLMSNDAHCNDQEYVTYLKNQYLALNDMMHDIGRLYTALDD